MANVAHSSLTGSNLHENKGAASASDNTVATITTGATVWKKLTRDNLAGTANPFGSQLFHFRDEKTSANNSGTLNGGSWNQRDINTVITNEITGASLNSNQFTLPAGTYHIRAGAPTFNTNEARLRLWNVTASTMVFYGPNVTAIQASNGFAIAPLEGRFTIAGSTVFQLQQYIALTRSTDAGGRAISLGGYNEVYTEVFIWKIA